MARATHNVNIDDPGEFKSRLQHIMIEVHELFELAKEHDLEPIGSNGAILYSPEDGKCDFQVARQYARPSEFLQVFLDMVRVNFEPYPLGTFFLNSNLSFLYEELPDTRFQLAYLSLTSSQNQSFAGFWAEDVLPHIKNCGYQFEQAMAVYAVATTGDERYGVDFVQSVNDSLQSGISVDDALGLLASALHDDTPTPRRPVHSGFCVDPGLQQRIRLSLWMFIPDNETTVP
jgi:hypothetical protein